MKAKFFHKISIIFLVFVFLLQTPSCAFFAKKVALKPINVSEKVDYINMDWWRKFDDPYLNEYILKAVEHNHDARKVSWKVEEYRQFVKYQFGQELPSLAISGYYDGVKFPDGKAFNDIKSNIFVVPLTASYEADIFLKNRDKTRASKKAYESSRFEEKAVYISLVTDVATVYFNVVKFDKQIELQKEVFEIKKEKLRREGEKFKRGLSSATVLNNYKKEYESSKNNLEDLIKTRDKSLTQLAVLIGDSPENICSYKRISFDNLEYRCTIPDGISSDVVFSRPDIMAAEAELEKSKIDVRVARKEFLPKFNVTGLYSLSNLGVDPFGSWASTFAAIIASTSIDLFKGGMKVANLKINKSRYEQMFEAYRQADLVALKEVNDSLMMVKRDTAVDFNTKTNLNIQNDNYNRSINRYKNGVISYPQLLSEKEVLINSKLNQVNSKTNRLIDYLTLYKAVGGKL